MTLEYIYNMYNTDRIYLWPCKISAIYNTGLIDLYELVKYLLYNKTYIIFVKIITINDNEHDCAAFIYVGFDKNKIDSFIQKPKFCLAFDFSVSVFKMDV